MLSAFVPGIRQRGPVCAVLLGLLGLALTDGRVGQDRAFRASADLVRVYVTVRSSDGRLIRDLTQDDFVVFDDDRRQPITTFSSQPVPISLVAAWDLSPSMTGAGQGGRMGEGSLSKLQRLRAAAHALVSALWKDDRTRFGTFSEEVAYSPVFTANKDTLHRIVREETWPGAFGSPVWTALSEGVRLLASEPDRRVLLVLTDGEATEWSGPNALVGQLDATNCMLYVVALEEAGLAGAARSVADRSGGGHAVIPRDADLSAEFASIVAEIHHQYLIGFVPEALDGQMHRLTVRVNVAGATARARGGYLAGSRR